MYIDRDPKRDYEELHSIDIDMIEMKNETEIAICSLRVAHSHTRIVNRGWLMPDRIIEMTLRRIMSRAGALDGELPHR